MDPEISEPSRSRHALTLRKKSSVYAELYKERKSSLVPLARSPFKPMEEPESGPEPEIRYHPDEYVVFVTELPWSDLLLEIAMTTAFASLTDGTPILEASSVSSYLSFFALVWWVWASQVAYNVRFRQSDWLHRTFAFFQLVIFCALAAFTNNFDVTNGIVDDSAEEQKLMDIRMADFVSQQDIAVANFRNNRMPTLNTRGISLTMGFSRLLLLVQYLLTLFHALRHSKEMVQGEMRPVRCSSFLVHIGTLGFSSMCYFIAYAVIGKDPDQEQQIAKLALWYVPLLIEVASHFVAAALPGRVRYPAKNIYERKATVFIIILGGGLDKITNGFQYIVGNVSIGVESLGLILCGVVTFALLFSLYFGTSKGDGLGSRRALASFFFQFFYLSALIVTLQGIAAMLQAGNIGSALETPFQFVGDTQNLFESKGFGVPLNESDYGYDMTRKLNKTGVALHSLLQFINAGVNESVTNQTDYNLPYNYLLQADMFIIASVLRNFKAMPDDDSMLAARMNLFYDSDMANYTAVNNVTFNAIAEDIITTNATPALWFYASGGLVLVMLAVMNLFHRWPPRDKYEWAQTISRFVIGSCIIAFTAIDVNASKDVLDTDLTYQGSRIWYLATHSLVLPIYALALIVEQAIELALLHLAGRSYTNFSTSVFWRTRAVQYAPASTTDPSDQYVYSYGSGKTYDEPFDNKDTGFDGREGTGYVPVSQPTAAMMASPPIGAVSFEPYQARVQGSTPGGPRRPYRQMASESSVQTLVSR